MLEKHNTPFSPVQGSAAPARRLWNYLVRQENVQEIFIRAVFGKKRGSTLVGDTSSVAPSSNGGDGGTTAGKSLPLHYLLERLSVQCFVLQVWTAPVR